MKKIYFCLMFCGLLFTYSCKKAMVDNETTSSTDYALATREFIQLLPNITERASVEKGLYKLGNPGYQPLTICPVDSLTGDTAHDAQGTFTNMTDLPVMWLQYANCAGADGKIRNGTVKVSFTKKFNVAGCIATVSLSNYVVNGVSYQGTITITRNSANSFIYNVTAGVCSDKTGSIKYNCNYKIDLFDNGTPGNAADDYIQVSGNANGADREGKAFDASITDALKKRTGCAWITEGIVNLTPEGLHTRALNFGNGSCDDVAVFLIDGQTFTVHLSK